MNDDHELLRTTLRGALSGRGAHVLSAGAFDGLTWEAAGLQPPGAPHTAFRLLNHLVYWQEFALRWLGEDKPVTPEHDQDSWPGPERPADQEAWESSIERYKAGQADLAGRASESDLFSRIGPKTVLEILQIVAAHTSYHVGQVAALRRALGAWPPPGGGMTW